MSKIIIILFVISILMVSSSRAEAVDVKKTITVRIDSSKIKARAFNQAALNKARTQRDFQYTGFFAARSLSDRFWSWVWSFFKDRIADAASNKATKIISILVLTGLIVFLVIKFSGAGVLQLFTGKTKTVLPHNESLENIHQIDFDPEIEKAIKHQNYRFAVRMLYLKCLKKLSDSGLISWQIDKTNTHYIAELDNSIQKEKFAFLTRKFEYIWYGEFNIDLSAFGEIHDDFNDFNKGLQ